MEKSDVDFSKHPTKKNGLQSYCKSCTADASRKAQYGIDANAYYALLDAQGGVCAICGKVNANNWKLSVDHDHQSGKIRGLLCHLCNIGLGGFGDDIESLSMAIAYLSRNK
jgi:hypothetical protein